VNVGVTVDPSVAFVAGHSLGSYTAQLAIGMEAYFRADGDYGQPGNGSPRGFALPQFDGAVLLSGPGAGIQGITPSSWDRIAKPYVIFTGSRDATQEGNELIDKLDPFNDAPPGGKHAVFITGANHVVFPGSLAGEPAINAAVRLLTLDFLDAYAHGDRAAVQRLTSDDVGGREAQLAALKPGTDAASFIDVGYKLTGAETGLYNSQPLGVVGTDPIENFAAN